MTNVVKIKPNMNVRMDVIRVVVDAGVRAAFANFNNEQLKQLIKAPYQELLWEKSLRKAA